MDFPENSKGVVIPEPPKQFSDQFLQFFVNPIQLQAFSIKINPKYDQREQLSYQNVCSQFRKFKILLKDQQDMQQQQVQTFKIKIKQIGQLQTQEEQNVPGQSQNQQNIKQDSKIQEYNFKNLPQNMHPTDFFSFAKNRVKNSQKRPKIIYLGVCDLRQLISLGHKQRIIPEPAYTQFLNHYNQECQYAFHELDGNQLSYFDFSESIYCLMDHRLFSQVLCRKWPNRYRLLQIPQCYCHFCNQFFNKVYAMSFQQYMQNFNAFNKKFNRKWMLDADKYFQDEKKQFKKGQIIHNSKKQQIY